MRKYLAETIDTGVLSFAGCGAIVVNDLQNGVLGHTGVCLVFVVLLSGWFFPASPARWLERSSAACF